MYCVMSGWENTIVNIIDTVLLENHFFYYEEYGIFANLIIINQNFLQSHFMI